MSFGLLSEIIDYRIYTILQCVYTIKGNKKVIDIQNVSNNGIEKVEIGGCG